MIPPNMNYALVTMADSLLLSVTRAVISATPVLYGGSEFTLQCPTINPISIAQDISPK